MTITLIEDDFFRATLIRELLVKLGFQKVQHYRFISEAIRNELGPKHLIILNEYVNGISGIDYIRLLKSKATNTQLIYLAPGNPSVELLARAKYLGADFFIRKDTALMRNLTEALKKACHFNEAIPLSKKIAFKTYFVRQKKPLIYLLDDDPLFTQFIKFKLNKYSNFSLEIFTKTNDLMARARQAQPSLLLLDYTLVEQTTGLDILDQFLLLSSETKIVMFSAQTNVDVALSLFEAGIADYIFKSPTWENSLLEIIEKHINLKCATKERV